MKENKTTVAALLLVLIAISAAAILAGCTGRIHGNGPENKAEGDKFPDSGGNYQDNAQEPQAGTGKQADMDGLVEELVSNMTIGEKVGQMVVVGIEGHEVDDDVISMIKDYHVGGFIFFGRNVKDAGQLVDLTNSIKKANSINRVPIFVSVDEEGGRISRMPEEIVKLPSNREIGNANDETLSYEIGKVIAEELKSFGFNMNFAPVLDIDSNPQNPVIGERSYGSSAEIVSRLGMKCMKGIMDGGVIPVVKHFPGHGDTSVDSHVGLPVVESDMDRLRNFELVPFAEAINNGADAVMVAHILLNKVDPEYPASLSKTIITGILREELNFDGVVITDDITMGAVTENYDVGQAAVMAVNAGSDIVLVCHGKENRTAVLDALTEAARSGNISEKRLDESVKRILRLKYKHGLEDNMVEPVNIDEINGKINEILDKFSLPSEEG